MRNPLVPITAVGAAVVIVVGSLAAVAHHPDRYPARWDPRVADLVDFVQDERGHDYVHPVDVEFLSPDEYSTRTRGDEADVTDEDRAAADQAEGLLRALGMVTGDIDLFESTNDLNDTGTLAFYDSEEEVVTVRGDDVTPSVAITLVHELTHVLQDQLFDLDHVELDGTTGAETAYRALVEGDAIRIERAYRDTLDDEDQAKADQEDEDDQAAVEDEDIPEALEAIFGLPYALGEGFVEFLAADDGNDSVDDAFRDPPTTEEDLLDPYTFLDGDGPKDVGVVTDPEGDGIELLDEGDFGAASLFLVLASRIDVHQALAAAFGWGGDAYLHYAQDDRSCVDMRVTGDEATDTDEIGSALEAWAAAGPSGAATVGRDGDVVTLHACDPGADADVVAPNSAIDALSVVATRTVILGGLVEAGAGEDFAECYADGVLSGFSTDELLAEDEPADFESRLDTIASSCPV